MLGIHDPWVAVAYVLCLLSALLCVGWGVARWNQGSRLGEEPDEEVRHWAEEEAKVEDEL